MAGPMARRTDANEGIAAPFTTDAERAQHFEAQLGSYFTGQGIARDRATGTQLQAGLIAVEKHFRRSVSRSATDAIIHA